MRLSTLFVLLTVLLLISTAAHAKDPLMVRDLEAQRVDTVTAKALSDIIKSALRQSGSQSGSDRGFLG